jgi:pilus assembly protein CpaC
MHRTLLISKTPVGIVLLTLLAGLCTAADNRAADETASLRQAATATSRNNKLVVPIGTSHRLQMKDHKVIQSVVNPKENIAVVQPVEGDPRTVLITGHEAGVTHVTLTAADKTEETYEVHVEFDVEFLRSLLARAVPTASLQLIPGASGVIIITGTVAHSEDIDVIMRAAQSVVTAPDRVINAMRVGGVVQVQLDCVVAFVSRSELRRMSFDWLIGENHGIFASTVGQSLTLPALGSSLTTVPGSAIPIANTIGSPNGAPVNLFLGLFNGDRVFFGLLQALKDDNLVKILAEPKLMTLSGRTARLLSGGQQAIPEAAGLGSISVRFEPFGTQLSFLPIVMGDGKIYLEIEPEVSNLDPTVGTSIQGTVVPGRSTQNVHTAVLMEDGQTLAIGGLIQNEVVAHLTKVPIVGSIPVVGALFSSKTFAETERELVVLVTPHLVDPMACDQVPKLVPGQETRSPDDYELFLEQILEAPRGPRVVCRDGEYVPAYKNGPTAGVYPCGGGHCNDGCGSGCVPSGNNGGEVDRKISGPAARVGDRRELPADSTPASPVGSGRWQTLGSATDGKPSSLPPSIASGADNGSR